MESLEQQRRRIRTVGELQSVVTTVKALAAASAVQYENSGRALASFFRTVEQGFQVLLRRTPLDRLLPPPYEEGRPAIVVIGTDQGMCGPFNDRLARFTRRYLESVVRSGSGTVPLVVAVGAKMADALEDQKVVFERVVMAPSSLAGVREVVHDLLFQVEEWQAAQLFQTLLLFYNEPHRAQAYRSRCRQILPLDREWLARVEARPWSSRMEPVYSMPWRDLFSSLTKTYLLGAIQRAIVASLESENRSRLAAMQAAERNINELRDELEQDFRRRRQEEITRELLEIVSGFEVVVGGNSSSGSAVEKAK